LGGGVRRSPVASAPGSCRVTQGSNPGPAGRFLFPDAGVPYPAQEYIQQENNKKMNIVCTISTHTLPPKNIYIIKKTSVVWGDTVTLPDFEIVALGRLALCKNEASAKNSKFSY